MVTDGRMDRNTDFISSYMVFLCTYYKNTFKNYENKQWKFTRMV